MIASCRPLPWDKSSTSKRIRTRNDICKKIGCQAKHSLAPRADKLPFSGKSSVTRPVDISEGNQSRLSMDLTGCAGQANCLDFGPFVPVGACFQSASEPLNLQEIEAHALCYGSGPQNRPEF